LIRRTKNQKQNQNGAHGARGHANDGMQSEQPLPVRREMLEEAVRGPVENEDSKHEQQDPRERDEETV